MKIMTVIFLIISGCAQASERFSTEDNRVSSSKVTWIQVDSVNVYEACDLESKRRGNGGFQKLGKGQKMDGCSFWSPAGSDKSNTCFIITSKNTDHDTIGHEIRHCFQGSFHK